MEVKVAQFGEGGYRPDPKPPEKFLLISIINLVKSIN